MPICVHYKFACMLLYATVLFSGQSFVLVGELKQSIMRREKLNPKLCDLKISDAESGEEFKDENDKVKKNASVIVRRVPRTKPDRQPYYHNQADQTVGPAKSIPTIEKTAPLSVAKIITAEKLYESNASEEDKIKAMMQQSNAVYDAATYMKTMPKGYVCFRCQIPGHHIRDCPTHKFSSKDDDNQKKIKRSSGIPKSFLKEVDDPNMEGVMMGSDGRYVIPAINAEAYESIKKRKRPAAQTQEDSGKQAKIAKTSSENE